MAKLFLTGWETGDFQEFINSKVGTCNVVSNITRPLTSNYSMRCNPTSGTGYVSTYLTNNGTTKVIYAKFMLYIATAPSAETALLSFNGSSAGVYLKTDRTLVIRDHNGNQIGSASSVIPLDEWHSVSYATDGTSTIGGTGKLDDSQFATGSGSGIPHSGWNIIYIGVLSSCTTDLYFDDFTVNDGAGSDENSWPTHNSRVSMIRPNAAGDNNEWGAQGGAGGTTNYQRVDEESGDGATTYIDVTLDTEHLAIDDYNCFGSADIGMTSLATIICLSVRVGMITEYQNGWNGVYTRIKAASAGTVGESAQLYPDGTGYEYVYQDTTSVNHGTDQHVVFDKPGTSNAWTPSDIDSMQLGVKSYVDPFDSYVRVTQVYANVEYTQPDVEEKEVTVTAKARVKTSGVTATVTAKANIKHLPAKTVLVSPADAGSGQQPITFVWEIPADPSNRAVDAHLQVDDTSSAFGSIEKDLKSWEDSGFEYWNGSSWVTYPTTGVTSAYYGNQARISVPFSVAGTKYWRVRGGVI